MTLNEIQSTLDQLKQRHPDLNEGLLITLLEAGGWEESKIKEARMLFKASSLNGSLPHEDKVSLPEPPEFLLEEHNVVTEHVVSPILTSQQVSVVAESTEQKEVSLQPNVSPTEERTIPSKEVPAEKESLITQAEIAPSQPSGEKYIPHDLPLKPFEASPHAWKFSKYKDIFYGDIMPTSPPPSETVKTITQETIQEIPKIEIKEEKVVVPTPEITLTKVPLTKKDEGIVALAVMLAFVVILLSIYMYSQGRL